MASFLRLNKRVIGGGLTHYLKPGKILRKFSSRGASPPYGNSNSDCPCPNPCPHPCPKCGTWNNNWDCRSTASDTVQLKYCENTDDTATRHLILIRSAQYDPDYNLTEKGKRQADVTGQRLASLDITQQPYVYNSQHSQSSQTADHVVEKMKSKWPKLSSTGKWNLNFGYPVYPEPQDAQKPTARDVFVSCARTESAFRAFFYRPDKTDKCDSYTMLVTHDMVIAYLVCRALQVPLEAYLRINPVFHCALTWILIDQKGYVRLRFLGTIGHLAIEDVTPPGKLC